MLSEIYSLNQMCFDFMESKIAVFFNRIWGLTTELDFIKYYIASSSVERGHKNYQSYPRKLLMIHFIFVSVS